MGDKIDRRILCPLAVVQLHIKRQGNTVAEARGQVVANHMVRLLDPLPLTLTCQSIRAELRAFTLEDIAHIHAEDQRAVIEQGYTEIPIPRLALLVFLNAHARARGDLGGRKPRDQAKLSDTVGDLLDLLLHCVDAVFHFTPLCT